MKLEKFEAKSNKRRKAILISISVLLLVSVSFLLYKTFASFTKSAEFQIMKGQVDYFGNSDVYFAFYNENDKLESMPLKDNDDNLVFSYGECDNGAYVEWNSEEWAPLIKNLSKSKTKCSLYFREKGSIKICNDYGNESALCYISKLGDIDYTNLAYDGKGVLKDLGTDDNNLRYVGTNPNNYIDIGDKESNSKPILWRIIGIMNNVSDSNSQTSSYLKIIRSDSIGNYCYDTSSLDVNSGNGVNEWSQSDAMKLINPKDIYNEELDIGGSIYWNKAKGDCYSEANNGSRSCDFTSIGLSEKAKSKFVKINWNTGTYGDDYAYSINTAKHAYEGERSNHNGKEVCQKRGGGPNCNDNVERKTNWIGYLGLMYASDYGYAVGGMGRKSCLTDSMYYWNTKDCYEYDWLYIRGGSQWTMTPVPHISDAAYVFRAVSTGNVTYDHAPSRAIRPVGYLNQNLTIKSGNGLKEDPYVLE